MISAQFNKLVISKILLSLIHIKDEAGLFFIFIFAICQTDYLFFMNEVLSKKANQNTDLLTVDKKGRSLEKFYLSLDVEHLWIAGTHINWETGVADKPDATSGNHTHCSAFVASACERLGIYILRPPEHGQILLANAQYDWLQTNEARKNGWAPIANSNRISVYTEVQKLANTGRLVIAIIKSPDDSKPGHAALIMPKEIDEDKLMESGPVLIMAGTHNFNFISLKNGFRSHVVDWPENEILFYVNNKELRIDG